MKASSQRLLAVGALCLLAACASEPNFAPTAPLEQESVRPGINDRFLAPAFDPQDGVEMFEVESREVYSARDEIVAVLGVRSEMVVADVGAGTGLFLELLNERVGEGGRVYAVDIAPKFVDYMQERVREEGLTNVATVRCTDRSVGLPGDSLDLAFLCDTYHHFEFPQHMLASLGSALRSGGELVIVDFERVPGVSSDWILGHVRAGKEEVIAEVEAAGFEWVEEIEVGGLTENYAIRFRRP